jgi:hypothetical protein
VEMWSVSAITLFSLTRHVSCFLLTFNADTHFGSVSLVTHACDVPRFVAAQLKPTTASSVCTVMIKRMCNRHDSEPHPCRNHVEQGMLDWQFRILLRD